MYDSANRLPSRQVGGAGITAARVDWAYTERGQVGTVTRYSDLGGTTVVARTVDTYDNDGRLTNIVTKTGGGTVRSAITYTLDANDRITQRQDGSGTATFAYDATNQVTAEGAGTTFGYDATGNRTNSGYVTGTGNRTTNDGTWTYTYDTFGAVTKRSKGSASETWVYGYDFAGRMVSATKSATDGGAATARVTYVYDVFGNRIESDTWDGTSTSVEKYVVDGWDTAKGSAVGTENFDTVLDLDGSNAVTARRVFGAGFDDPVARQSGGAVNWYVADAQGSVRQVLDNAGAIAGTLVYSAFGVATTATGSVDRYRYTGAQWDAMLGLQYNRARMYDPASGKWLSADPEGFAAGDTNLYRYANNQATTGRDPSGKWLFVRDGDEGGILNWLAQQGVPSKALRNDGATWVASRVRRVVLPDDLNALQAWRPTSTYGHLVKNAMMSHAQFPSDPHWNLMYTASTDALSKWSVDNNDQGNAWNEYTLKIDGAKVSPALKANLTPAQQARLFENRLQAGQYDPKSDVYRQFRKQSWKEAGRDAVIKQMMLKYDDATNLLNLAVANGVDFKSDDNEYFFSRASFHQGDIRVAEKVGLPFLWLNSSMSVETAADYLYTRLKEIDRNGRMKEWGDRRTELASQSAFWMEIDDDQGAVAVARTSRSRRCGTAWSRSKGSRTKSSSTT